MQDEPSRGDASGAMPPLPPLASLSQPEQHPAPAQSPQPPASVSRFAPPPEYSEWSAPAAPYGTQSAEQPQYSSPSTGQPQYTEPLAPQPPYGPPNAEHAAPPPAVFGPGNSQPQPTLHYGAPPSHYGAPPSQFAPQASSQPRKPRRKRRWVLPTLASVVAIAVLATGGYFLINALAPKKLDFPLAERGNARIRDAELTNEQGWLPVYSYQSRSETLSTSEPCGIELFAGPDTEYLHWPREDSSAIFDSDEDSTTSIVNMGLFSEMSVARLSNLELPIEQGKTIEMQVYRIDQHESSRFVAVHRFAKSGEVLEFVYRCIGPAEDLQEMSVDTFAELLATRVNVTIEQKAGE